MVNYLKELMGSQNGKYEIQILYFQKAYQSIFKEIYPSTKELVGSHGIFIVTSRHCEVIVKLGRE